jgi:Inner membrane protein YgaP-like, transmembrane domain
MTKNMGSADRILRILLAVVVGGLYFTGRISGTVAIVLMVFAVAFLVTSAVGWCPGYLPFGFSTRGKQGNPS